MGLELCWEMHWYEVITTKCWFYEVEKTDFFLAGWRLSGTEFIRESIRENFPSTSEITKWGKSHCVLPEKYYEPLLKRQTKVIFCLADPRDVATHILTWRQGQHIHTQDEWEFHSHDPSNNVRFLNDNLRKITEMLEFFSGTFGENMLTLRYEDAVNDRPHFLRQVSDFLGEDPLNVDNEEKYLPEVSIYKPIGIYSSKFSPKDVDEHLRENIGFYRKWKY